MSPCDGPPAFSAEAVYGQLCLIIHHDSVVLTDYLLPANGIRRGSSAGYYTADSGGGRQTYDQRSEQDRTKMEKMLPPSSSIF